MRDTILTTQNKWSCSLESIYEFDPGAFICVHTPYIEGRELLLLCKQLRAAIGKGRFVEDVVWHEKSRELDSQSNRIPR